MLTIGRVPSDEVLLDVIQVSHTGDLGSSRLLDSEKATRGFESQVPSACSESAMGGNMVSHSWRRSHFLNMPGAGSPPKPPINTGGGVTQGVDENNGQWLLKCGGMLYPWRN